jgi:drug/metabolite transporter (DMT)-like permease
MLAVILGLASASAYGVADYAGGRAASNRSATRTTAEVHIRGLLLIAPFLLFSQAPEPRTLLLGGAVGILSIGSLSAQFQALATGPALLVAPLAATVGAVIVVGASVIAGDTVSPGVWVGGGMAFSGQLVLLAPSMSLWQEVRSQIHTVLAVTAVGGLFAGLALLALSRVPVDGLVWALAAERAVTGALLIPCCLPLACLRPARSREIHLWIVAVGYLAATTAFVLAVKVGSAAMAGVLSSQYPVVTVVVAWTVGRQSFRRGDVPGLMLTALGLAALAGFRGA